MKPITAKEAREITDAYSEAGMDDILKNIKEGAAGGNDHLTMNYISKGQIKVLESLGYDAKFYDIGREGYWKISW
jgi:hypothetical protein